MARGQPLEPGERVVELASVSASAALVAGAVAGVWIGWILRQGWMESGLGFVAGAALGYGLGQLVARHFYRGGDGNTAVVRVGAGSLPATLRAGLMGGILAAMALGVLALLVPGAKPLTLQILGAAVFCGAALGAALACLSSLL
jgi:hypothetical protein